MSVTRWLTKEVKLCIPTIVALGNSFAKEVRSFFNFSWSESGKFTSTSSLSLDMILFSLIHVTNLS
jgi:hypothetical protein